MPNTLTEILSSAKLLPVFTVTELNQALPLAETLIEAGFNVIELTLRSAVALSAIELLSKQLPHLTIAAGTILFPEQISDAMNAGAKLLVSPGFNLELVKKCQEKNFPYLPGVATASEMILALTQHCSILKFYPAELIGGPKFLEMLRPIFPMLKFYPTGGITAQNLKAYLNQPNVIGAGGSWIVSEKLLRENNFSEIGRLAKEAKQLTEELKPL